MLGTVTWRFLDGPISEAQHSQLRTQGDPISLNEQVLHSGLLWIAHAEAIASAGHGCFMARMVALHSLDHGSRG